MTNKTNTDNQKIEEKINRKPIKGSNEHVSSSVSSETEERGKRVDDLLQGLTK